MKANPGVNNFINDTMFADKDKGEILTSLRDLVLKIAPNAKGGRK